MELNQDLASSLMKFTECVCCGVDQFGDCKAQCELHGGWLIICWLGLVWLNCQGLVCDLVCKVVVLFPQFYEARERLGFISEVSLIWGRTSISFLLLWRTLNIRLAVLCCIRWSLQHMTNESWTSGLFHIFLLKKIIHFCLLILFCLYDMLWAVAFVLLSF